MGSIQIRSTVGPDGVLALRLPLGASEANHEVIVTIQPTNGGAPTDTLSWPEFVERTYGSCRGGEIERAPQGEFERREAIE